MSWNTICTLNDILPYGGRAALLDGEQVAVFRIPSAEGDKLFAVANHDPFSGANVLSRGLVGSIGDTLVVASPIYKQHFDLATGQCLEDESVKLKTWPVRLEGDDVQLASTEKATA